MHFYYANVFLTYNLCSSSRKHSFVAVLVTTIWIDSHFFQVSNNQYKEITILTCEPSCPNYFSHDCLQVIFKICSRSGYASMSLSMKEDIDKFYNVLDNTKGQFKSQVNHHRVSKCKSRKRRSGNS